MLPGKFRNALLLLYTISGITALSYEILWMRVVSQFLGVSIFGVVATVAAFMTGLGLGCLAASHCKLSTRAALRIFGFIEAAIAIYALIMPVLLHAVDGWLDGWAIESTLRGWYVIQGLFLFGLLLIPAIGMGIGFPLVLRVARGICTLGAIYGTNTLGGVIGALLPLFLLPLFGWTTSLQMIAAIGLLVSVSALWLSRGLADERARPESGRHLRPATKQLLAYAGIGMAALMLEIAWTRLYGMLMLRTEYVLAVVLAVILFGMGAGSVMARRLDPERWLSRLPPLAVILVLAGLYVLPAVAAWAESMHSNSLNMAILKQGGVIALCTLPVTWIFGAWLPLIGKYVGGSQAGGWLYGANSIGAAFGAILAGFVILPLAGSTGLICVAGLLLFVCGMTWAPNLRIWLFLPILALLAIPVFRLPQASVLLPLQLAGGVDRMHYEDAVSITHVVELQDGRRLLLADLQRTDASSDPTAVAIQKNQARLPLLLHPSPHSVLFLGLGTAITAAGSLPFKGLERMAVELSRGAILAARNEFSPVNKEVMDHLRVVHDDARRFLKRTDRQFDVIVGDLFHPDMVGRSNLLSVQQFMRVRRHLSPGGVYAQWLALNQFDIENLKVVMRSFRRVFPAAMVFMDGFHLGLVGTAGDEVNAGRLLEHVSMIPAGQLNAMTGGEGVWTWLGRYWGPIPEDTGPVQDEWSPVIEFSLPQLRFKRQDAAFLSLLRWMQSWRVSPTTAAIQLQIPGDKRKLFTRAYATTGLNIEAILAEYESRISQSERLMRLAYRLNPQDRWAGFALADHMYATLADAERYGYDRLQAIRSILDIRPDHIPALKALLRLEKSQGRGKKVSEIGWRLRSLSPLDRGVREMTTEHADDRLRP